MVVFVHKQDNVPSEKNKIGGPDTRRIDIGILLHHPEVLEGIPGFQWRLIVISRLSKIDRLDPFDLVPSFIDFLKIIESFPGGPECLDNAPLSITRDGLIPHVSRS